MVAALFLYAALVDNVRAFIAQGRFDAAAHQARVAETHGVTPEVAEAFSWIARGELDAKRYDQAQAYAAETRKLSDALLRTRRLDAEPVLPIALGASIEVRAQALAATGARAEAVVFLREQAKLFAGTSIMERIRKNVNLLDMTGKPAPELSVSDWIGFKPPTLASLRGHPVLLFFWAHWCVDCKADAPIIASLQKTYASKGLVVIAPTRFYGYVGNGDDAPPAVEKPYIERVQQAFYSAISPMPTPLSAANFQAYGASTTPTLALIDASGIVRMYHPGAMSAQELSQAIRQIVK
jgi:thiol-disulfide isomerase/thioredoxin